MELEKTQAKIIDHYLNLISDSDGAALVNIIKEATSHRSLVTFTDILAAPNVAKLEGTEHSVWLDVLRFFRRGTWSQYKCNTGTLPELGPGHILKLKQLTLLTLAESNKVVPYDLIMQELDMANLRELKDFLIHDCLYAEIVEGKLNELRQCFEVRVAAERDLIEEQLGNIRQTLSNWLRISDNLLVSIEESNKWYEKKVDEYKLEQELKSLLNAIQEEEPTSVLKKRGTYEEEDWTNEEEEGTNEEEGTIEEEEEEEGTIEEEEEEEGTSEEEGEEF